MYGRVKNILKLEVIYSKRVNGEMQEFYANLLLLSLTALIALGAACELKLDSEFVVSKRPIERPGISPGKRS